MKITSTLLMTLICLQLFACNSNMKVQPENHSNRITNSDTMKIKITIGTHVFNATLNNNATVTAFKARLPMSINMNELNGNEKYFNLSDDLATNASNPGTIQTGDLMLYGSNTLVLFYKTFSTSYNYTKLGRIENSSSLAAALGSGNAAVKFELE